MVTLWSAGRASGCGRCGRCGRPVKGGVYESRALLSHGALPPIAKPSVEQAKFRFMMGYTEKLAGTGTGVLEPQTVCSRFFGAPIMSRNPKDYTDLHGPVEADVKG